MSVVLQAVLDEGEHHADGIERVEPDDPDGHEAEPSLASQERTLVGVGDHEAAQHEK